MTMRGSYLLAISCLFAFASATPGQAQPFVRVEPKAVLLEKGAPILSAAFSKDGKLLAIGGVDSTVQVWDVGAGQKRLAFKAHRAPVSAVVFTPDGKQLLSASFDKTVRITELADGAEAGRLDGFKLAVLSLAISPDGKTVLAGTGQWNRKDLPEISVLDFPQRRPVASLAVGNDVNKGAEVAGLVFAPDGKSFAAAVRGNGLQSWDLAKRAKIASYYQQFGDPATVAISPDGLTVAAGYSLGQIALVDAGAWKELATIKGHKAPVVAVSFSADGRTLVSGSRDGGVKLWDVSTLEIPESITIQSGAGPATLALFAPQGKSLALAGFDGKLVFHEVSRTAPAVVKIEPNISSKGYRLALVATDRAPAIQNLLTLAEAKLSAHVQLLDRKNLDALLAEQKLSLAGFVKHDQIVQAGKLLGVDLFAVVETDKLNKQAVGLVVFNAQTGVRFWDATLPTAGLEQSADAVTRAVRGVLNKQQLFGKDLATICLTTVRNADLPRSQDALCDLVGHLLERGLVSSPNLAVLERTRLDQVAKEQNLPTDSPLGQMLASLVRIELEVGKAVEGKGLRGTAFLVNNRGQNLGKVSATVAEPDPAALAEALLQEMAKPLKAKPVAAMVDRVREVFRLSAEADFFQDHKDWPRSLKARQAANALKPDDLAVRAQLANTAIEAGRAVHRFLSQRAVVFAYPSPSNEELQQSLALIQQGVEALIEVESKRSDNNLDRYSIPAWFNLITYLDGINKIKVDDDTRAVLEKVQEYNVVLQELRQERAYRQVNDKASYAFYTAVLGDKAHHLSFERQVGLTEAQFAKYREKLLTRWLSLAEKWGDPPLTRAAIQGSFSMLRGLESLDSSRARKYRQTLLETNDPHVLLYDRQADFLLGIDKLPEAKKQQRVQEFQMFVQQFLVSDRAQNSLVRYHSYQAAVEAVNVLFSTGGFNQPRGRHLLELCRFMIEQRDLMPKLIQEALHSGHDGTGSHASEEARFALVNQILAHVDSGRILAFEPILSNPSFIESERQTLKKSLLEQRQQIVARFPDLDRKVVELWPKLQTLVDVAEAKTGIVRLLQPIVHDGSVYVVGLGRSNKNEPSYLELLQISLQGGEQQRLGRVNRRTPYNSTGTPIQQNLMIPISLVANAVIHDGRFILGTKDQGIVIFSLHRPEATQLNVDTGLPSNNVQQLGCLNGKVIAGLGVPGKEGYLIMHDLKSGSTEVLASSRRKDSQSALDNTAPLQVLACRADPKHDRLLAYIWLGGDFTLRKFNGLWEIDDKTGRLKLLQNLNPMDTATIFDLEWAGPIVDDKMLLALCDATYLVNLSTNEIEKRPISQPATNRLYSYLEPRLEHLTALLNPGERTIQLRNGDFFHKGWLYTAHPFGRTSLDGKIKEAFPSLRSSYLPTFQPWESFQVAGQQILIADQHALWLAPLP